jgi:hypothetical protein
MAGAYTLYGPLSSLGLRTESCPTFQETTLRVSVIVAVLVAPSQVAATPVSDPEMYIEVPLKVISCDSPQWLEEAVHEPPELQVIRSGRGPRIQLLAGEHSFICRVREYVPATLVLPPGLLDPDELEERTMPVMIIAIATTTAIAPAP